MKVIEIDRLYWYVYKFECSINLVLKKFLHSLIIGEKTLVILGIMLLIVDHNSIIFQMMFVFVWIKQKCSAHFSVHYWLCLSCNCKQLVSWWRTFLKNTYVQLRDTTAFLSSIYIDLKSRYDTVLEYILISGFVRYNLYIWYIQLVYLALLANVPGFFSSPKHILISSSLEP